MRPSVRRDGIVVRELPDETLVYDERSHKAHCLNRTAAAVFRAADGTRSVEEIAAGLVPAVAAPEAERDAAVRLALDELEGAGLLLPGPEGPGASRREALRRMGLGAALLLPAVVSVLAPTPAEALTTCVSTCTGNLSKSCADPANGKLCDGTHFCNCEGPVDTCCI
jgi:hypothetical protein